MWKTKRTQRGHGNSGLGSLPGSFPARWKEGSLGGMAQAELTGDSSHPWVSPVLGQRNLLSVTTQCAVLGGSTWKPRTGVRLGT